MKKFLTFEDLESKKGIVPVLVPEEKFTQFRAKMKVAIEVNAHQRRMAIQSASKVILTQ